MIPYTSSSEDQNEKEYAETKVLVKREPLPKIIRNIIILHLPLIDILIMKEASGNDDSIELWPLFHDQNHKHLTFRFTRNIRQVFSLDNLRQMGVRKNDCFKLCKWLYDLQSQTERVCGAITTIKSGVRASTIDYDEQDICCTLDGNLWTFWSSDGSEKQEKVDWLLYDLGTVAVVSRISIAAFKATFHINSPTYGFKKCWIEFGFEQDEFHYKTREFSCSNTNDVQDFTASEHFGNILPAARYIKFWMRGCHQQQRIDDLWYFAIQTFSVAAFPVSRFPKPVPEILKVANVSSKEREWLKFSSDGKRKRST